MLTRLVLVLLAAGVTTAVAGEPMPTPEEIGSVRVYLSADEGRRRAFPTAVRFERRMLSVPDSLRAGVQARLGRPFADDRVDLYIARGSAEATLGYAVVADEIGKYRPITFLVTTTPDLQVASVAILVYRESRGAQVRRPRFLGQYRGKDPDDPIRINRDIINITGATLSVRALNVGVKKVLLLLETLLASSR